MGFSTLPRKLLGTPGSNRTGIEASRLRQALEETQREALARLPGTVGCHALRNIAYSACYGEHMKNHI